MGDELLESWKRTNFQWAVFRMKAASCLEKRMATSSGCIQATLPITDASRTPRLSIIEGVEDRRSAWALFQVPDALAERVTQNLLRVNLRLHPNINFTPADEVQAFIEVEQSGTSHKAHYLGAYDNRLLSNLDLSDPQALVEASGLAPALAQDAVATLYGIALEDKMASRQRIYKDIQTLSLVIQRQDKRKESELTNGFTYGAHIAHPLLEQHLQELAGDEGWYVAFDAKVFALHCLLTEDQPLKREELLQSYAFLMAWIQLLNQWQQEQQNLQGTIQAALSKGIA